MKEKTKVKLCDMPGVLQIYLVGCLILNCLKKIFATKTKPENEDGKTNCVGVILENEESYFL